MCERSEPYFLAFEVRKGVGRRPRKLCYAGIYKLSEAIICKYLRSKVKESRICVFD